MFEILGKDLRELFVCFVFVRTSDLEGEGFLLCVDKMIKTRTMLFLSSGAETTNHMLHDLSYQGLAVSASWLK